MKQNRLGTVVSLIVVIAAGAAAPVPSLHSPLFAPDSEPAIKTATTAETMALLELPGK